VHNYEVMLCGVDLHDIIFKQVCIPICLSVCPCVCVSVYIYIHIYIYIYNTKVARGIDHFSEENLFFPTVRHTHVFQL
jgi:hypothetical protein